MEYITLAAILVLIVLVFVNLVMNKQSNKADPDQIINQKEEQNELKLYFQKEYGELKFEMGRLFSESNKVNQGDLNAFKDKMMTHVDAQLQKINERVEQRLGEGFEKTNQTFVNVMERLSKIDEAQKKIEALSSEVVELNVLLTDKKTRGIFGEVQLYHLLSAVFGENKALYEKQKKLSNDNIADAVIYAPEPLGMIAIDAKFPLDNYKRMVDRKLGEHDRKNAEKEFKNDIKKHINDIKNKYIVFEETGDQAFMFVPAEAIFAELYAYHEDLIDYATKNKIWIASPTTLLSTLSLIQVAVKNLERDKQAKVIIEELNKLGEEFKRYSERWDKLKKSIDSVSKNADQVHITSAKINTKFKHISEAKFDEIEIIEVAETESEDEDTRD